jgi:Uma2 family endonuclease
MPASLPTRPASLADLLEQLGDIDPRRVRAVPPPGTATEQDLLDIRARERRLYELVDGVLVEKVMGFPESTLACDLIKLLGVFLDRNPLGFLAGMDGAVRLMPGLVRIPDISFVSWEQLPTRERPTEPIPDLAPALAVEILSEGNTRAEMRRKVKEYFVSGVRVVWLVDPRKRTVRVYSAPDASVLFPEGQSIDGGDVLPGLVLPVEQVFAGLPRPGRGKDNHGRARRKNGTP